MSYTYQVLKGLNGWVGGWWVDGWTGKWTGGQGAQLDA